jgi:hypothetical protein
MPIPSSYSPLVLEGALCVWEEWIEADHRPAHPYPVLHEARMRHGAVACRLELAPRIGEWAATLAEDPAIADAIGGNWSYDWEFVPFVMGLVRRVQHNSKGDLVPTVPTLEEARKAVLGEVSRQTGGGN